jgi:hypothetical protein
VLELAEGDIDPARLRQCQEDAAAGRYAEVTAAFIQWLAPRLDALQHGRRKEIERLRDLALADRQHRRTPEIVANLALGWECFLAFLHDAGILTRAEVFDLWRRAWEALGEAADAQRKHQVAAEPVSRFVHLLQGALAGGYAHVADRDGEAPEPLPRWGWERGLRGRAHKGKGTLIGWLDEDGVFLEPEAAFSVVQRMARDQTEPLAISLEMLCRLLHERKYLLSIEQTGNETLGGKADENSTHGTGDHRPPDVAAHIHHEGDEEGQHDEGEGGADGPDAKRHLGLLV